MVGTRAEVEVGVPISVPLSLCLEYARRDTRKLLAQGDERLEKELGVAAGRPRADEAVRTWLRRLGEVHDVGR